MYEWQRILSKLKTTYSTQSWLKDWYIQLLDNKQTRGLQQDGGIMMFLIHRVASSIVKENSR